MLGAQITSRLLPEQESNHLIYDLILQCDTMSSSINSLVPVYHCLHTPGGSLKFSLEGHQFAVFGLKLTSDSRYVISVSNKVITFDVNTGDMTRVIYPNNVEGLMMDMDISTNNKHVAAFTNNNQIILLDNLTNEYKVKENPFNNENISGLVMLDDCLIVYSFMSWVVLNFDCKKK